MSEQPKPRTKVYLVINRDRCENYSYNIAIYLNKATAEKSCGRDDYVEEFELDET